MESMALKLRQMATSENFDLKSKYFCNAEQLILCVFLGKPT